LFGSLARQLPEWSLRGVPAVASAPAEPVEDIARRYIEGLRRDGAASPFHLAGYSFGAVVAFEMARQLLAAGEHIGRLILIDPPPLERGTQETKDDAVWYYTIAKDVFGLTVPYSDFKALPLSSQRADLVLQLATRHLGNATARVAEELHDLVQTCLRHSAALERYQPLCITADCTLIVARQGALAATASGVGIWGKLLSSPPDVRHMDCLHTDMFDEPHVGELARSIAMRHHTAAR
jgi:thioesterase domain-containing protein